MPYALSIDHLNEIWPDSRVIALQVELSCVKHSQVLPFKGATLAGASIRGSNRLPVEEMSLERRQTG